MSFKLGKQGEEFALGLLKYAGFEAEKTKKELLEYDLEFKVGRKTHTVEVKFDYMSVKTGNIAIEFFNTKKGTPSGIDATKADIWMHLILDNGNIVAWIAKTSELKEYIAKNAPKRTITNAGDDNASLYIYNADKLLDGCFVRIDNITDKELLAKQIKRKLK